jgi:hypothetical protein
MALPGAAAALAATPHGALMLLALLAAAACVAAARHTAALPWLVAGWLRARLAPLQRRGAGAGELAITAGPGGARGARAAGWPGGCCAAALGGGRARAPAPVFRRRRLLCLQGRLHSGANGRRPLAPPHPHRHRAAGL